MRERVGSLGGSLRAVLGGSDQRARAPFTERLATEARALNRPATLIFLRLVVALTLVASHAFAQPLPKATPESVGMSTDRLKRMINASGFKVWPAEVEALLFRHPAVAEACVISTRDPYRGETVKAVIVLRHDARETTAQQIIDWAHDNMAAYKVPRIVEFADALPKSGSGKVMWRALQERESAR